MKPEVFQTAYWQPPMMQLTSPAHPDWVGGKERPCFVPPHRIVLVERVVTRFKRLPSATLMHSEELTDPVEVTVVFLDTGTAAYVTEAPAIVATLRDKALGVLSGPKAI